jgi:hypothetical protein
MISLRKRRLRICLGCFFGSFVAGLLPTIPHPSVQTFAVLWFPGLVFGFAFALSIGGSRTDIVSFASISAIAYFCAVQSYLALVVMSISPLNVIPANYLALGRSSISLLDVIAPGLVGAFILALAVRFVLSIRLRRYGMASIVASGVAMAWPFLATAGRALSSVDVNISRFALRTVTGYVMWQTLVGTALAFSMTDSFATSRESVDLSWRWVVDAIGIIGSLAGIISFFR